MTAIHQFVAGFSTGDAISNEARVLREMFRRWGHPSEIFADPLCIHPSLRRESASVHACTVGPRDLVLLHLSMGSPVNDVFRRLDCRKIILYHNITPHTYFSLLLPQAAELLRWGRDQLRTLAGSADVNLAVSGFNAAELEAVGYTDVHVLPIVLDFDHLDAPADTTILDAYGDDAVNVIFVGRCAPNKCIDDLVRAFGCFQRNVEPNSRLIHVGAFNGLEAYQGLVRIQARNLGLRHVHFMGAVTLNQLVAFYRVGSLFLCMSDHEGFCIPLLESMYFDVPILAYAAGAVPETLAGAGVLFTEKRHEWTAEMMGRLVRDPGFRDAILAGQRDRLQRYRNQDLEAALKSRLTPLLGQNRR